MAKRLPDEAEVLSGAPLLVDNATRLLQAAEATAAEGLFGPAASLTVLGYEEAVKARALMGKVLADRLGRPFALADSELGDLVYRNHQSRHLLGFWQHVPTGVLPALYGFPIGRDLTAAERYQLTQGANTAASANKLKMRGLYVDFEPNTAAWTSPADVTEADYLMLRATVDAFLAGTQEQLRRFLGGP